MKLYNRCINCFSEKGDREECPYCNYVGNRLRENSICLLPGTLLAGKYFIGTVLGRGGFGVTYLGWDSNLDIKLAIKEYFPHGLVARLPEEGKVIASTSDGNQQFEFGLEKFLEEAKTLAKFEHNPGIVTVRDFFRANGTAYMIMSYIEGITLEDYLFEKGGKLPLKRALDIMLPVMDALKEIHRAGFMHRDISPDNILIDINGRVIIIDFGAARQEAREKSKGLSVILKAGYAPEEQHRTRGKQGPWTDVYAVSATFYRALTGEKPPEAIDRLAEDVLISPSKHGVEISTEEEEVLLKGLALHSDERYQSIEEFQQDFLEAGANDSKNRENIKKSCTFCGEKINLQAPECHYCHSSLEELAVKISAGKKDDIEEIQNNTSVKFEQTNRFIAEQPEKPNEDLIKNKSGNTASKIASGTSYKKETSGENLADNAKPGSKLGPISFIICVLVALFYLFSSLSNSVSTNDELVIILSSIALILSIAGIIKANSNKALTISSLIFSAFIIFIAFFNLGIPSNVLGTASEVPGTINQIFVPENYSTIQAAIDAASDGEEIIVAEGIYQETIDFKGKNIVLRSIDPDNNDVVSKTVIDGDGKGTVITFKNGESRNAILSGFTITGGSGTRKQFTITSYDETKLSFDRRYAGGILVSGGSEPTISKNIISGNNVINLSTNIMGVGGGIAVLDGSNPLIENNMIINNFSEAYGGGIAVWHRSSPKIINNIISGNKAEDIGGGLLVAMICSPEINSNIIQDNQSANWGGGIYVGHMSEAKITGNIIMNNSAVDGGGIFLRRAESVLINDNEISDNRATKNGGAIFMDNRSDALINNNKIFDNAAQNGGAAWVDKDSQIRLSSPDDNEYRGNKPDDLSLR